MPGETAEAGPHRRRVRGYEERRDGVTLVLRDGLAGCLQTISDPTAALRRYETLRRPRTAGIAHRAYHLGWIGQWRSAPLCVLRDRLVAWTPDAFHRLQMLHLFRFADE
jgi:2-polyprenyl-6-methoxyphenol hydroxylase-like FAD-dependent oxidoreductase